MGYDLHKIGLARPSLAHQRFARNIVINWFLRTRFEVYEAFQEGLADPANPDGLVPDVIFCDARHKPLVAVEIERGRKMDRYFYYKCSIGLCLECGIPEVFAFDYEGHTWYKAECRNGQERMIADMDYSEILDVHLDDLLLLR